MPAWKDTGWKIAATVSASLILTFIWWLKESHWFQTAVNIGIGSLIVMLLLSIWWLKRRVIEPLLDLYAHMGPLVSDVAKVLEMVNTIRSEVQTNGGLSLKDFVLRLSDVVVVIDARQRGLMATQARPTFEADPHFNITWVNRSLEVLTTYGLEHLANRGWVSHIHEEDRDEVMTELQHARKPRARSASASFRFVTDVANKRLIRVRLEATPIFHHDPKKANEVVKWFGSLVECEAQQ